jgi:hypothetical protein
MSLARPIGHQLSRTPRGSRANRRPGADRVSDGAPPTRPRAPTWTSFGELPGSRDPRPVQPPPPPLTDGNPPIPPPAVHTHTKPNKQTNTHTSRNRCRYRRRRHRRSELRNQRIARPMPFSDRRFARRDLRAFLAFLAFHAFHAFIAPWCLCLRPLDFAPTSRRLRAV